MVGAITNEFAYWNNDELQEEIDHEQEALDRHSDYVARLERDAERRRCERLLREWVV